MKNILRAKKIKSRGKLTQLAEHNFRLREQRNIDKSRTHLNQVLVNNLDVDLSVSSDLQTKLSEHYEALKVKEKKDSVLALELVVSASPGFFVGKTPAEINDWANNQVDFFKNQFGENLRLAVLHLDEKTPHIHLLVSVEERKTMKYKNQKGEFFKEVWSLNAKRFDPAFFVKLHDDHAEYNKKWKLERGERGSNRKHTPLKEFYKRVDQALTTDYTEMLNKVFDSVRVGIFGKVSIDEVKEKLMPKVNAMFTQNKALREMCRIDFAKLYRDLKRREKQASDKLAKAEALQQQADKELKEFEAANKALAPAKELRTEIEKLSEKVKSLESELDAQKLPVLPQKRPTVAER